MLLEDAGLQSEELKVSKRTLTGEVSPAHLILAGLSTRSKPVQVCRDILSPHIACVQMERHCYRYTEMNKWWTHLRQTVILASGSTALTVFTTHYLCAALYHFQMAATCIILLGYQSHPGPALYIQEKSHGVHEKENGSLHQILGFPGHQSFP